uniref:Uncharacterized protein n=1 Tax=Arundo donax TaxID=35708 RepID=A0A0A9CAY9_ARUDO
MYYLKSNFKAMPNPENDILLQSKR